MSRWPQVGKYPSRPARWPDGVPGMGDEATWPSCSGHPNDPRIPDLSDDEQSALAQDCLTSLDNVRQWANRAAIEIDADGVISDKAMRYLEDIRAELADYTGKDRP